jgi:hypothetical protein
MPSGTSAGVSKFIKLKDAPSSYSGQAGKAVKVKTTEDGLEFVTGLPPSAHASTHESGGSDAINPANIGADWNKLVNKPSSFPPSPHASSHQVGGSDVINVEGLSGVLADYQKAKNIQSGLDANKPTSPSVGDVYIATDTGKIYKCITAGTWTLAAATKFTELSDVPSSYAGQAGKAVVVKDTEDGLEFGTVAGGIASGWELIKKGTFTGTIDITGLNGDTDEVWFLIVNTYHTSTHLIGLRFNGDAGANYNINQHFGGVVAGTAIHRVNTLTGITYFSIWDTQFNSYLVKYIIFAKSGSPRKILYENFGYTDTSNFGTVSGGGIWNNSTDNITTITVFAPTVTAGYYYLFRQKSS